MCWGLSNGFNENRFIEENIRLILDLFNVANDTNFPGLLERDIGKSTGMGLRS